MHKFYFAPHSVYLRRNGNFWLAFFGKWSFADILILILLLGVLDINVAAPVATDAMSGYMPGGALGWSIAVASVLSSVQGYLEGTLRIQGQTGMYVFCSAVILSLVLGVALEMIDETYRRRLAEARYRGGGHEPARGGRTAGGAVAHGRSSLVAVGSDRASPGLPRRATPAGSSHHPPPGSASPAPPRLSDTPHGRSALADGSAAVGTPESWVAGGAAGGGEADAAGGGEASGGGADRAGEGGTTGGDGGAAGRRPHPRSWSTEQLSAFARFWTGETVPSATSTAGSAAPTEGAASPSHERAAPGPSPEASSAAAPGKDGKGAVRAAGGG
eukprot:scaffold31557_cov91-Isochrysis_galbana.AAC.1